MPRSKGKPSFKHHLGPICTLVFESVVVLLLLTHLCAGQSQVVTPSQPIVATLGDDITLPCHLEPAVDVTDKTVEWARSDLDPRFVYLRRAGVELESRKHPSYVGRTSLSINKLKDGDVSLKLDKVKVSDKGTYRCFVPSLQRESSVQLVVGATSSLILSLEKTDSDEDVSGAVLQCEAKGWYPKPEVLWLDGEGKLLSAGPAEPIRGPDGLYTVSSRVTVEKKHSKSFTCRVQQKNINQTRETTFHVSDDFIILLSSSSALTAGFAVSLSLCILLILLFVFFLWRRKRYKSKKTHQLEEGREREQLMSAETEKVRQQLQEEQQTRKSLEDQLETKNKELETKKKEVKGQQAKVQRLIEEKQGKEKELQSLKERLEQKNKEFSQKLQEEQKRRKEAENHVKNLGYQLETKNKEVKGQQAKVLQLIEEKQRNMNELQTLKEKLKKKNKEVIQQTLEEQHRRKEAENQAGKQQAEVQRLSEEIEKKEKELQTLMDNWKKENQRLEDNRTRGKLSLSSIKLKEENLQRLTEEMWKKEKELQSLNEELEKKNKEDPSTPWNFTNRRPT